MRYLILLALALGLSGCASTGLFSEEGPALIMVDSKGVQAVQNGPAPKVGKACVHNILGIIVLGDATIEDAKKDGGITNVMSVNRDLLRILTLYGRVCVVVRGT